MKSWAGAWYVLVLVGGAGLVGCGGSASPPGKDAGSSPDAPMSTGGILGTGGGHGTGGAATGGLTAARTGGAGGLGHGGGPGTGGTVATGGSSAAGGRDAAPGAVTLTATYDDGQVHATWQNQTSQSIFLAGCGTVEWWRLDGTTWVNHGGFMICAWEGPAVEVPAGGSFAETHSFTHATDGRYRLSGTYGVGCTPGKGLSSAGCTDFFTTTSNEFVVADPRTRETGTGGVLGRGGAGGTAGRTGYGGAAASDGGPADGSSGCTDVCALYGEACCLWTDPCIVPAGTCTLDVLAASVGTAYEYDDLETKVATLPKDISATLTDQDIAWAAADPYPAGRIELHLTDAAASQYGTILDGAKDGRVFRVSCGGQSRFVGVFYLIYGAAALNTPVLHESRENGVLVLRLGAYQSAWFGMGLTSPESAPLKERIDRPELRAALCRRGVMHVLDPDAKPATP